MLNIMLWSLEVQRRDQVIRDGVKAMVRAYYEEFTDATTLEPRFIQALESVVNYLYTSNFDLEETIVEAEKEINEDEGGIQDSEGDWHKVGPTFKIEEDEN